jgi:hypothetical protein
VRWSGFATSAGLDGGLRAWVALLAEQVIAPVLAAWHAEYPSVVLDQTTAVSQRLLGQVGDGSLDVAFIHLVPALAAFTRVEHEVVWRGGLAVLMGRRHPLASRASVALGQLSAETFLVNRRELAPSARGHGRPHETNSGEPGSTEQGGGVSRARHRAAADRSKGSGQLADLE